MTRNWQPLRPPFVMFSWEKVKIDCVLFIIIFKTISTSLGFHNYHHAFPWDYSASELGPADVFNPATAAIDFFHYMGWAWDLKKVKPDMIDSKMRKSGDPAFYHKHNTPLYEWTTGFITLSIPLVAMFGAKIIFGNVDENSTSLFMQILSYTNFAKFLK